MPLSEEDPLSNAPEPGGEPSVTLVEVEPGVAVLFAEHPLTDLDLVPFEMLSPDTRHSFHDKLAVAAGLGNLAVQGAQGAVSAQGLVRLAPQTLDALKTLQPVTSGGWNLGTLAGSNGQFAHAVRWAPAVGAQSATMLAALGPAAALLALQMQLASISRRVDENIELTRDVLRAVHEDQWATLLGLYETTTRAVREARAVGVVNDHIFAALRAREADLRKQRHLFGSFLRAHLKALDADAKGRRAYVQKNAEQIIADAHGVLMAESSWYRYQVLRAAHIGHDIANAIENEPLLADLTAETQREHTIAMDELTLLLDQLERQCRLTAELPGERTLPFTSKRQASRDTVAMAAALSERTAELSNRTVPRPAPVAPQLTVFNGAAPDGVLQILRWAIPGREPVLAIADLNLDRLVGDNAYLAITSESFFLSAQSSVRKQGIIDREYTLADVRYVRFRERGKQGPALDIITKNEDLKLTFDDWASTGSGLEDARRFSDLLATAMNLPEEERRADPLLLEGARETVQLARS